MFCEGVWPPGEFSRIFFFFLIIIWFFRNFGLIIVGACVLSPNERIGKVIAFQPLVFLVIPILIPKGMTIPFIKCALKFIGCMADTETSGSAVVWLDVPLHIPD
jgi:hypothetical protein